MRTFPFKVPEVKLASTSGVEAGEVGGGRHGSSTEPERRDKTGKGCLAHSVQCSGTKTLCLCLSSNLYLN